MEPTDTYRELKPTKPLRDFVECFWTAQRLTAGRVRVLPDGCADLLIDTQGTVRFVSTMTTATVIEAPAGRRLFAVRFRPGGAAALFGVSMNDLADYAGPWSAIDSRRTFDAAVEDLFERDSVAVMQSELSALSIRATERRQRAIQFAQRVVESSASIASLAEELSVSRQHLNRSVRAATGISAKHLSRVGRLRRLTAAANDLGFGASAALAAGYCDQSHMVNEFRALAGTTPRQYLRERS